MSGPKRATVAALCAAALACSGRPDGGAAASYSALAVGLKHACGVRAGALFCWGDNSTGQLGNGTLTDSKVPVAVAGLDAGVSAVATEEYNTCAIQAGALLCWGDLQDNGAGEPNGIVHSTPVPVPGLQSGVTAVATGLNWSDTSNSHTCAIQAGALYCWGNGNHGELGNGESANSDTPVPVSGMSTGVTAVAVGGTNSCAVQNGALYCWGYSGETGIAASTVPVACPGLGAGVTQVAIGLTDSWTILAVMNGTIVVVNSSSTPAAVQGLSAVSAVAVAGSNNICAISGGALYCWSLFGSSFGNGITSPMAGLTSGVTDVALGTAACAVQDGGCLCWGDNEYGQYGNGTTVSSTLPEPQ